MDGCPQTHPEMGTDGSQLMDVPIWTWKWERTDPNGWMTPRKWEPMDPNGWMSPNRPQNGNCQIPSAVIPPTHGAALRAGAHSARDGAGAPGAAPAGGGKPGGTKALAGKDRAQGSSRGDSGRGGPAAGKGGGAGGGPASARRSAGGGAGVFSPLWVLRCRLRWELRLKHFPQAGQA